jgi:hypothetical protein
LLRLRSSRTTALQRLKRDLRELGLAEREGVFERRGLAIARVRVDGAQLAAAIVQRPSRNSPQWQDAHCWPAALRCAISAPT